MNNTSNLSKKDLPKTPESIFFQGISSTGTSGRITWDIGISDFLKGVVSGEYISGNVVKDIRDIIHSIRTNKKGSPEYNKQKKTLPGVCVQGKFKPDEGYPKGRRQKKFLSGFTNIVAIDIDNIKDISKVKSWVIEQLGKHSFAIAYSPGNKGLHVYLYAEIKSEKDIAQVLGNVSRVIGVKVDPMTKDCTRFLNCTWDPDAYINETPDQYEFITAPPTHLPDETPLKTGTVFLDIENLLTEKKLLGKVRYTDNVIWKTFLILAKQFPREHVEKYLSDESRRKRLFHPQSATVNDLPKIKTNLDNAFIEAKKWQQGFGDYFKTDNGIYIEYKTINGEKRIGGVNASLFRSEHGEFAIKKMRYYYSLESVPNNYPGIEGVEFMPIPKGVYNLYDPLKHQPAQGDWENIKIIFEHFTRDQTQYVYDYVKLLLTKPSQILPILVLISPERETGKTTMLNFFCELLYPNSIIIPMLDFSNRFNSHYATKSLVAIDESKLDKKELEKIKSISTALNITCEFKGRDAFQVRNYQHYILTSNSPDFAYYDKQETRFWCFEFPTIKEKIPGLYEKVVDEIPAFIHYLLYEHVMAEPESQSRAWFSNDVVTQYFKDILYEQTKHPDINLLKDMATQWFAVNPDDDEMRFMAEKVRRFFKINMPISEFVNILMNEPWINRYDRDEKMQYHLGLFNGTPEINSQLSETDQFPATLSKRTDRRGGLFYIKREDLINPNDDDDGDTQSNSKEDDKIPF